MLDPIIVPVRLDLTGVTASIGKAIAQANATIKLEVDSGAAKRLVEGFAGQDRKVLLATKLDTKDAARQLREFQSGAAKLSIRAALDVSGAGMALEQFKQKSSRMMVNVDLGLVQAGQSIAQFKRSTGEWTIAPKFDLSTAKREVGAFKADYAREMREVQAGAGKFSIRASLDTSGAGIALEGFKQKNSHMMVNVDLGMVQAGQSMAGFKAKVGNWDITPRLVLGGAVKDVGAFKTQHSKMLIDTDLNLAKAGNSILKFQRSIGNFKVEADADVSKARSTLAQFRSANGKLEVAVSAVIGLAAKALAQFRSANKKLVIDVSVDADRAKEQLAKLRASGGIVTSQAHVDLSKGAKELADFRAKNQRLDIVAKVSTSESTKELKALQSANAKFPMSLKIEFGAAIKALADFRASNGVFTLKAVADLSGVARSIKTMKNDAKEINLKVNVDAAAAKAEIKELKSEAKKSVAMKITADASEARKAIGAFRTMSGKPIRVSVGVDEAAAKTNMRELRELGRKITIPVGVDTTLGKAGIEALRDHARPIKLGVSVDSGAAKRSIAGIAVPPLAVKIAAPAIGFFKGLGGSAARLFSGAFGSITNSLQNSLMAIGGFLAKSFEVGNEVDSIARRAAGISGTGDKGYRALKDNAMAIGARSDVTVSTKDVIASSEAYIKAGRSLEVAIAAQLGVAKISTMTGEKNKDIAGNLLDFQAKFSLSAEEQTKAAALFAGLLTSSKMASKDAAYALKYSSPDGGSLKDLENATKVIALMASSGIRGSSAATSSGAALRNLPKMSEALGIERGDGKGGLKDQLTLILETRKALLEMRKTKGDAAMRDTVLSAKDGLGVNGGRAMLGLLGLSEEKIKSVLKGIDDASTRMSAVTEQALKQSGLGSIAIKNSVESLQVRLSDSLAPAANAFGLAISNTLNGITSSPIWAQVDKLTVSLVASINSPAFKATFAALGIGLSQGILKAVQGLELMFRLIANPPKMPDFMADLIGGAAIFFDGLRSGLAAIFSGLQKSGIFDVLIQVTSIVQRFFGEAFKVVGSLVGELFKLDGTRSFMKGLTDSLAVIGPVLMSALSLAGSAVRALLPTVGDFLGLVGRALQGVAGVGKWLVPPLQFVGKALEIAIVPTLGVVVRLVANLVALPTNLIVTGLYSIVGLVNRLALGAKWLFNQAYSLTQQFIVSIAPATSSIIRGLGTSVTTGLSAAWTGFIRWISGQWGVITQTASMAGAGLKAVWQSAASRIAQLMQWAIGVSKQALAGLSSAGVSVANYLRNLFAPVGSAISGAFTRAQSASRSAFNGILSSAQYVVNSIRNAFNSVASSVSGAFSSVGSRIANAFRPALDAINSMRNAIANMPSLPSIPRFSLPGFAAGGVIGSGRSRKDDQLILAQRGEGIVSHRGMDVIGPQRLALLNAGISTFATGGIIGEAKPKTGGGFTFSMNLSGLESVLNRVLSKIAPTIGSALAPALSPKTGLKSISTYGGPIGTFTSKLTSPISSATEASLRSALNSVAGVTKSMPLVQSAILATLKVLPLAKSTNGLGAVNSSFGALAKVLSGLSDGARSVVGNTLSRANTGDASGIDVGKIFKGSNWDPSQTKRGANADIFTKAGFSDTLITVLKTFEGFKANAYDDGVGVKTIGFGSTTANNDPLVRAAMAKGKISVEEANTLMLSHLKKEDPRRWIQTQFPALRFNGNQMATLVSLYYNGGPGIVRALAAKSQTAAGILKALPDHWVNKGTGTEAGLRNRRAVESRLFAAKPMGETGGSTNPLIASLIASLSGSATVPAIQAANKVVSTVSKMSVSGVSARTFIRASRTGKKDKNGLEILKVDLVRDGMVVDTTMGTSGQSYNQKFEAVGSNTQRAGSMAPVPEGLYKLGGVDKTSGSFGAGLGNTYISVDGNEARSGRSAIGLHRDANISVSPGSAGCIVFNNQKEIDKVAAWVKSGAKDLAVDWGLGTVKTNGSGKSTLTTTIGNPMSNAPIAVTLPDLQLGQLEALGQGVSNSQIFSDAAPLDLGSIPAIAALDNEAFTGLAEGLTDGLTDGIGKPIEGLTDGMTQGLGDLSGAIGAVKEAAQVGSFYRDGTRDQGGSLGSLGSSPLDFAPSIARSNPIAPSLEGGPLGGGSRSIGVGGAGRSGSTGGKGGVFQFNFETQTIGGREYVGVESVRGLGDQLNDRGFLDQLATALIDRLRGDDRVRGQGGF